MIKQLYATRISIEIKVIMSSQGFGPRMTDSRLERVSSRVQDSHVITPDSLENRDI